MIFQRGNPMDQERWAAGDGMSDCSAARCPPTIPAGFETADSGSVTVQVLPFDSGAHAAAGEGSVSILQFDQTPGLGLVHMGGIGGGVCLEGQDDLGAYARAFDRLRGYALSPERSAMLLRDRAGFRPC